MEAKKEKESKMSTLKMSKNITCDNKTEFKVWFVFERKAGDKEML